jgi:H+-transporting ATPase
VIWIAIALEAYMDDWADFWVLMTLQILNGTVGFYEDYKAGNAVDALKASLKPIATVKRDGKFMNIKASELVPGDRIGLNAGSNVPADCTLCPAPNVKIQVDQSQLTGESLPVNMREGDSAMMGSTVTRGEIEAIVNATGSHTFFGKTAAMINSVDDVGHFQKVLLEITFALMGVSFVLVAWCCGYLLSHGDDVLEAIAFCVVLLVASIPIAMQVVCTSTMALGSQRLSQGGAIVTRLSSIEELAGMNMLCSDKTGTLTLNKMVLQDELPIFTDGVTRDEVLKTAALAAKWKEPPKDALDTLVLNAINLGPLDAYTQIDYMPFDPTLKRTEATLKGPDGVEFKCTKGAPQIVLKLAHNVEEIKDEVEKKVLELAKRGIRSLAVARTVKKVGWEFMGILTFLDPPRPDTAETIRRARENGVAVKMITGDQHAIAVETCKMVSLGQHILGADVLPKVDSSDLSISASLGADYGDVIESCDGFAEVFPEHKFLIVEILRQRGFVVGMTGDGVNDAPALKKADVGIAVEGSTDAARAAADIVLTAPGLSVIIEAITISRKIFQRMKNYVTYRIACTMQLLLFFFISVLLVHPRDFDEVWRHDSYGVEEHTYQAHRYFKLPVIALVLITILNDGTIIAIAYDKVIPSNRPEKWRLPYVFATAFVLGGIAVVSSIMLLFMGLNSHHANSHFKYFNLEPINYSKVMMMMYLKISLSDFLTVFSARTDGPFWEREPGGKLFIAAIFATTCSTIFALNWPFEQGMTEISPDLCRFVWGYCIFWFFVQDVGKILIKKALQGMMANEDQAVAFETATAFQERRKALYQTRPDGTAIANRRDGFGVAGGPTMSLEQALSRVTSMEVELKDMREVISKNIAPSSPSKKKKDKKKKAAADLEEDI